MKEDTYTGWIYIKRAISNMDKHNLIEAYFVFCGTRMSAKLKKKHSYETEYEEVPSYRNSSQLDFLNYNARHLTSYLPALLFLDVGPGLYDSLIGWVQAYFKRCRAGGELSKKKKSLKCSGTLATTLC